MDYSDLKNNSSSSKKMNRGAISLVYDQQRVLGHRRPPSHIFTKYSEVVTWLESHRSVPISVVWNFNHQWESQLREKNMAMGSVFPFYEAFGFELTVTPERLEERWTDEMNLEGLKYLRELTEDYGCSVEWTSLCSWALIPGSFGTNSCYQTGCFCDVEGWYIYRS